MKYLLILFSALSIASCRCPEIIHGVRETNDSSTVSTHRSDTNTTEKTDTNNIAPVQFSGVIDVDSLCEELRRIRLSHQDSSNIVVVHDTVRVRGAGSISLRVSSSGQAKIDCKTDSLYRVTDSLTTVITNQDSTITRISHEKETTFKVEVPVKDWWYKTYRALALIFIGLIVIFALAKWAGSYTKPFR